MFTEIDPDKLRSARKASGLSQSQLAEQVGVTKKTVYDHESRRMNALYKTASLMESVLEAEIINAVHLNNEYSTEKNAPRSGFELTVSEDLANIGFGTDFIYSSPFNIIAHERKMLILSEADVSTRRVERKLPALKDFSTVTGKHVMAITSDTMEADIPTISEKNLRSMSRRELKKLIRG